MTTEERPLYESNKDRALREHVEKQKAREIRSQELSKQIQWNNIDRNTIWILPFQNSYSEEDCRILLKESLGRLSQAQRDIKLAQDNAKKSWDRVDALKKKYKICEQCDTNKSTKLYGHSGYYCKRHMKQIVRLNQEIGPMVNKVFQKLMS